MNSQAILDKLNQEEKTELMGLAMEFRQRDSKSSSEYNGKMIGPSQYMNMYNNLALAVLQFAYSMESVSPHPLFEGRSANDWLEIITRRQFRYLGKRPIADVLRLSPATLTVKEYGAALGPSPGDTPKI